MLDPQELATALADAAHGDEALQRASEAISQLPFVERLDFLAAEIATEPIDHATAERRAGTEIEHFNVLQGDVVVTSNAFFQGMRRPEQAYVVATSTCDLVPDRRSSALLFPMEPILRSEFDSDSEMTGKLKQLTRYRDRRFFYLPVLPGDSDEVACNVAYLDPLCTCDNASVNLAARRASLTLFGWRLFGVITRQMLVREADSEVEIRIPEEAADAT